MPKFRQDELEYIQQAYTQGRELADAGALEDAIRFFDTVLGRLPRRRRDRVYRIDDGQSLRGREKVNWLPPIFREALLAKAFCLTELGRFIDATATLQRAAELDPENPRVFAELGFTHGSMDNITEARSAYVIASELEPENPAHLRALAHLHLLADEFDAAIAAAQRSLALEPNSVSALHQVAYGEYRLHRLDVAVEALRRAIILAPLDLETVLRLARRYRRKVLIASTSEVYGKSNDIPFREDADRVMGPTVKNRWSYAESKAMDEFLALAYHKQFGVPIVICRFFNTVGPRQTGAYGMVIPRLVKQAVQHQPLTVHGDGRQSRCFCNVRDTVRAVVMLSREPRAVGEIYNVGSADEVTILELAQRIIARAGSRSTIQLIPYDVAYEAGFEDMRRRVPSIDKIGAAIGWRPSIPLDQTLDEVIAQFRAAA